MRGTCRALKPQYWLPESSRKAQEGKGPLHHVPLCEAISAKMRHHGSNVKNDFARFCTKLHGFYEILIILSSTRPVLPPEICFALQ